MPTTLAVDLGIRGETDYDALFDYLHDLLRREAARTEYQVIAKSVAVAAINDAKEPPREVADQFRNGLPLEHLELPSLRTGRSASASSLGVRLTSEDVLWAADERRR